MGRDRCNWRTSRSNSGCRYPNLPRSLIKAKYFQCESEFLSGLGCFKSANKCCHVQFGTITDYRQGKRRLCKSFRRHIRLIRNDEYCIDANGSIHFIEYIGSTKVFKEVGTWNFDKDVLVIFKFGQSERYIAESETVYRAVKPFGPPERGWYVKFEKYFK